MDARANLLCILLSMIGLVAICAATATSSQTGESYTATASIATEGGATASAPITITVIRPTPEAEAAKLKAAFEHGGAAALRQALAGVEPAGSIRIASGTPIPARIAIERPTDQGRLLTLVTDRPLLFLGAGLPDPKPREGFEFGIVDVIVSNTGGGEGTMSPAAKVTVRQGAFVVDEYAGGVLRLTNVTKVK
jgi:hypothetical protein